MSLTNEANIIVQRNNNTPDMLIQELDSDLPFDFQCLNLKQSQFEAQLTEINISNIDVELNSLDTPGSNEKFRTQDKNYSTVPSS